MDYCPTLPKAKGPLMYIIGDDIMCKIDTSDPNRPGPQQILHAIGWLHDPTTQIIHPRKQTISIELTPGAWNLIDVILTNALEDATAQEANR